MGSLEAGVPLKRDPLLRSSSATRSEKSPYLQRSRSRFSRFLLVKKLDYLQWICTVVVFLFFVILFQMFLPGSVVEKSGAYLNNNELSSGNLEYMEEKFGLPFGEDIKFEPLKLMKKFQKEEDHSFGHNMTVKRFGYRKPRLAIVFADLLVDSYQVSMVTVAAALQEIGYEIQVYSLKDGPLRDVWKSLGVPVSIFKINGNMVTGVDWLNYDGIVMNSLETKGLFSCVMQEPFKSLPLIWYIHEKTLATRARQYASSGQVELLNDWKKVFNRASVVVFPTYVLAMTYSLFDTGNYYVIPGSPAIVWDNIGLNNKDEIRANMGFAPGDIVVAIISSEFFYRGLWLEHAFILEALMPMYTKLSTDKDSNSKLKILVLSGEFAANYSKAVEAISFNLKYPEGAVKHVKVDGDANGVLNVADLVIYGSFLEEPSFPETLKKAMLYGKPTVAPNLTMIRKYVDDRVNGYLFPKENIQALADIISEVIVNGEVSPIGQNVALTARGTAKDMMVSETVEGYAILLQNVLKLPSEVTSPKPTSGITPKLKEWKWNLFEALSNKTYLDRNLRSNSFLNEVEEQWNHTQKVNSNSATPIDDSFLYEIWKDQKNIDTAIVVKRREEAELKDRTDQPRGTWEEVYRSAKKADRTKNDLHERDDGELERTGQPLCIYEPYYGEGTWSFLHHTSLYRGIGLSSKGRRPGTDDIDAPSRLPLLNNPYYRDVLDVHGAFFALANRIDRVHKNAWIGFQYWRATGRKESLSKVAASAMLDAIQKQKHGDTLYFWARLDKDPRNPLHQDFWSFCDSINAGNCRYAFSDVLKKTYGMKPDFNSLPPMPSDGDTWSIMHSWALPTRSFLEFVMFSRMFVDALDAQMYEGHHQNGSCYLSLSKDKHCYSRLLELLVNVWAYHSPRRMVYVNPYTGAMQEQHGLRGRKGHMWIKWFSYTTLKTMDEALAEEADSDHPTRRWLWPSTGEVFWQGVLEKEKTRLRREKEKKKQMSRDKLSRMKRKKRQKFIGKYVKPLPEETETLNTTTVAENRMGTQ